MPSRIDGSPVMISAVDRSSFANLDDDSAMSRPAMIPIGNRDERRDGRR